MLDASMTMSWRFASEETPFSRTVLVALRDTYAEVPAVWLMEIAKVLAMGERRKRITLEESKAFQLTLSLSDVRVEPKRLSVRSLSCSFFAANIARRRMTQLILT